MAALATMTMGEINEVSKKVYPLFQKPSKPVTSDQAENQLPPTIAISDDQNVSAMMTANGKKPKKDTAKEGSPTTQKTEEGSAELLIVDLNDGRRKRRKTHSPERTHLAGKLEEDTVVEIPSPQRAKRGRPKKVQIEVEIDSPQVFKPLPVDSNSNAAESKPQTVMFTSTNDTTQPQALSSKISSHSSVATSQSSENALSTEVKESLEIATGNIGSIPSEHAPIPNSVIPREVEDKPKKLLRWNPKTGTIGSPPPKKSIPSKENGKRSTSAHSSISKSKIVRIQYDKSEDLLSGIGFRIEEILNSSKTATLIPQTGPKAQDPTNKLAKSTKPVHPLFMGKSAVKSQTMNEKCTESLPNLARTDPKRAQPSGRVRSQPYERPHSPSRPTASTISAFGNSVGILKFPGAIEPAWPWQGMCHVRGNIDNPSIKPSVEETAQTPQVVKKAKYQAVEVLAQENIIARLSANLDINHIAKSIREINPDEFPPLPRCLRIPEKHYEGGSALQRRVREQLHNKFPLEKSLENPENEAQDTSRTQKQVHPALSKTYNLIGTTLSAFDQGNCETQSWIQKYLPSCAAEVLQSGREAIILKEWLQTSTVKSVDNGTSDKASKSRTGPKSESNGKRKRKSKKLDGFIISSDEDEMNEITDPEDNLSELGGPDTLKKTVVRMGDVGKESKRPANAVVLSGPHGCGKTASVYAVAKELGFEIFEINSSSRRSGKDILEKVGDMTRNHLVQQSHTSTVVDDDNIRIDEALAKDLESGRQGTMNSFFKVKDPLETKPKANPTKAPTSPKVSDKKADIPMKAFTQQKKKQSLILIEEADIIYDEDKLFWATILTLVAQSKRPIIITCNNESSIPIQSLSLHAIIRFNPPPIDLAVDYMLLIAACEGHIIRRDAVNALYKSRNSDLRASIMELNFWCQFAVGDVKSGLDWFYPRWPIGSDVDEAGEKIRVVSEGTYETGMGWLGQDNLESQSHYLDIEENLLHESWDGWNLDAGDWQKTIDVETWATNMKTACGSIKDDRAALEMYGEFAEAMSIADICSAGAFAEANQVLMNTDQPTLSSKAREDYILAHEVIEASPKVDFGSITKDISLWIRSRARKVLHEDQHMSNGFEIPKELATPSEADVIDLVTKQISAPEPRICRYDFSLAFDPISEIEKYVWSAATLEASSFDRTITMIAVDLAPYVRSIVAYDARLQQDRARLSNLLSEGGRKGKRMRTTRAAMSALEGGARGTTRKDRYFGSKLNSVFVLNTGMESWTSATLELEKAARKDEETDKGSTKESGSERDELTSEPEVRVPKKLKNYLTSLGSDGDELMESSE